MNSYGDQQPARARASVPGPSAGAGPDDARPDAYRHGAAGRAAATPPASAAATPPGPGRASATPPASARASATPPGSGRASATPPVSGRAVPGRATPDGAGAGGGAPRGAASVGARASVGPAGTGRAAAAPVSGARVGGRASVAARGPAGGGPARAAVRPVSPAAEPLPEDAAVLARIENPRRGSAGKILSKAGKKRRRANVLTAAAAVVVILLGAGVVAGTWFFDEVELPDPKSESQSNTLLDANGKVLAKIGAQNRTVVPKANISPGTQVVQHAVAAAEDKNFYSHNGIDMKGIARAAWNNFTGGDTQGASTITQQYARYAADLKDISYNRKLREAVIARKLESKFDKDTIMAYYLNAIYLGQGRYGIEAAAQGYYNKSVTAPKGSKKALTVAEAAVLASIIKQPEPVPGGHQGYDPTINPVAAQERWRYTLGNMLEMKWISKAEYDTAIAKYPMPVKQAAGDCATACIDDKPVGMIKRHVAQELREMGIPDATQRSGGLEIKTTIDPEIQAAAEAAARRASKSSPMNKKPKTYQAALIAIDPKTGRVLGYYGGDNPNGLDYAGYMDGRTGKVIGGQSPGSTFKIYTLAAGLLKDISFKTRWDGTKPRVGGGKISNAGAEDSAVCRGEIKFCELEFATVKSYNFPFYWIADSIGPDRVVNAAKLAGVRHMWTDGSADGKADLVNLASSDETVWKRSFDREIGFGQYRVVPLEHANGVATIINGGVYNKAHFVSSIRQRDPNTGKVITLYDEALKGERVFPADQMSNLLGVLSKIPEAAGNTVGRPAAAKTGTWEFSSGERRGSGDAWMVGGIPQLAATVWVGGADKRVELKDGSKDMSGSGTPAEIWEQFLRKAIKAKDYDQQSFPDRVETGNPDSPSANGQEPPVDPCVLGPPCDQGGIDPNNPNPGIPGLPGIPGPGIPGPGDPGTGGPGTGDPGGQGDGNRGNGNGGNRPTLPPNAFPDGFGTARPGDAAARPGGG